MLRMFPKKMCTHILLDQFYEKKRIHIETLVSSTLSVFTVLYLGSCKVE